MLDSPGRLRTSSRSVFRAKSWVLLALLALVAPACDDSDDPSPATPIGEARGRATGEAVTVEGHVTVPPGAFSSALGDQGFAVQDDTGGVYVKLEEKLSLAVGARVRVTGTLDEQNQLRILKAVPADVSTRSGTQTPTPKNISTGSVKEPVEGQLIRVTGAVTKTFEDDSPYGYKLYIDDGSGEVQVFVHASAGFNPDTLRALPLGQSITVVGLAAQYETTYEVAPREPADLSIP
ncbi:DNA-binding protein [Myxococcus faecalis]|uniref:DNA-binding protein n=1 Tax=Myxococcus faecalis TaxID=3115646 RepID=UPI003CF8BC57